MKTGLPPVIAPPAARRGHPLTGLAAASYPSALFRSGAFTALQRSLAATGASLLGGLVPAGLAHAQQAGSAVLDGDAMLVRTVLALIFVIAMILGAAWLARRFGLIGRTTGELPMRVVASCAIGTRERVVVLEVEKTWLVLGVTTHNITPLHTLPANPSTPPSTEARPGSSPAAQALEKLWRRTPPPASPGSGAG